MQRDIQYNCTCLHTGKVEASELSKRIGYVRKIIWQTHTHKNLIFYPFKRSIASGFLLNVHIALYASFGFCLFCSQFTCLIRWMWNNYSILQLRSVPLKKMLSKDSPLFSRLCLFLAEITSVRISMSIKLKQNPSACQLFLRRIWRHILLKTPPPLPFIEVPINDKCPLTGKLPLPRFVWQS
jgi:hypothetical protein